MAITASMVKELREMTGAGMMDCKKALNESNGDMDAAIEYLRKNGEAKAVKKAGRIAAEGIVMADVKEDKTAAIVEVNSETDFVAKNADFQAFVKAVVNQALTTKATDMEGFMAEAWNEDASKTVNDAVKEALKNVAMQVAALNAKYVSQADVDADYIAHEKEILLAQIMNDPKESQKPEKVIQGMISGRINKEMKEICLLDQVYVKAEDGKQSVAKYLDEVGKANGTTITLKKFVRFETGEGLEKKNEDFAAEVAAQMNA